MTGRVRVVVVCRGFPTQRLGGMLHVAESRARGFARIGCEVTVLTTGLPGSEDRPIVAYDRDATMEGGGWEYEVRHLPVKPLVYSDEFGRQCRSVVETLKPGVVILESYDKNCLWWRGLQCESKVVIALHGDDVGAEFTDYRHWQKSGQFKSIVSENWRVQGEHLRSASIVVATCKWDYLMLRDLQGLTNVKLVYNPIPDYFWADRVSLPEKRVYGFFALHSHGARGYGEALQLVQGRRGGELCLPSGVARQKLPQEYDRIRCLLLPTVETKGYDLVVQEALIRNRWVIASATGTWLGEVGCGVNAIDNGVEWESDTPGLVVAGSRLEWQEAMERAEEEDPPKDLSDWKNWREYRSAALLHNYCLWSEGGPVVAG